MTLELSDTLDMVNAVDVSSVKKYLFSNNISNNYINKIEPFDFILHFDNKDQVFTIKKLLRVLPNRRCVFLANDSYNNKVVIKIFFSKDKYTKDYNLLVKNYNKLMASYLLTPEILYSKLDKENKISYVITKYIDGSILPPDQADYDLYIKAITLLHGKHAYQKDLHFDNFILNDNKIYYIDCESLCFVSKNLGYNKKFADNFALFLTQIKIDYFSKWPEFIKLYIEYVSKFFNIDNASSLESYIYKTACVLVNNKINNFIEKTQRNCSQFKVVVKALSASDGRKLNGFIKRDCYNDNISIFKDFFNSPDGFIDKYQTKILKKGNTAHVFLINYNNKQYVIKKYLSSSLSHQFISNIKYLFKNPRCISSWVNANVLESIGIKTAKPIASIMFYKYFFIQESFFIMEYSSNYKSFFDIINSSNIEQSKQDTYISAIINMLKNFKLLKLAHKDFKSVNLGFDNNELVAIDLDSMTRYKNKMLFNKSHKNDIKRISRDLSNNNRLLSLFNEKIAKEL